MSTTVADPPANGTAKAAKPAEKSQANSPENNPGLWCGISIPIIGVCGEKGEGKTLFAGSIDPEHTLMCDLEGSSDSYNLPFARRWNLYDEMLQKHGRVPTPLECFEDFRTLVTNDIKRGQFTVLAVDPITDIEQGMVDWVYANPDHFGHSKAQYDKAAGIMWGDVKSYWKMLLGIVATKVETLVFTAHMGAVWKGNSPVEGRRKAKGKETLFELASLYLQVERPLDKDGKRPDKPSARVLKSRLAVSSVVDGDVVHQPILPPYLKVATPKAIREYIKNPPNYAKLKKTEIAPPEEMSDDDRLRLQAEIAENQRVAEESKVGRLELMRQAVEQQVALRQQQKAKQAENAAKVEQAATVTTSTGTTLPATHEALSDIQEAGDRGKLADLHRAIRELMQYIGMTSEQAKQAIAKRGAEKLADLNAEQAEELRGKLQLVANKRVEAAKADAAKAPF